MLSSLYITALIRKSKKLRDGSLRPRLSHHMVHLQSIGIEEIVKLELFGYARPNNLFTLSKMELGLI